MIRFFHQNSKNFGWRMLSSITTTSTAERLRKNAIEAIARWAIEAEIVATQTEEEAHRNLDGLAPKSDNDTLSKRRDASSEAIVKNIEIMKSPSCGAW